MRTIEERLVAEARMPLQDAEDQLNFAMGN